MKEKDADIMYKEIKLSIIVPIYLVEKELPRCIESLVNQSYQNIEIILVNDGSPDNCKEICEKYARDDERIYVINKKNGGLSDARNMGISMATGDYFLLVDADDYIDLDTCQNFVDVVKIDWPDIVVGDYVQEYGGKHIVHKHVGVSAEKVYNACEYMIRALEMNQLQMEACFNLYNRSFWIKNGFEYKCGIYHEDMQLTPKVFLKAEKVKYMRNSFYHYVVREGSIMQQSKKEKHYIDTMQIYKEWDNMIATIDEKRLRYLFNCFLTRCFVHTCAELRISNPDYTVVSKKKLIKYAAGIKEKIKVLIFLSNSRIYYFIYHMHK